MGFLRTGERRPYLGSIRWLPEAETMQIELRNRDPPGDSWDCEEKEEEERGERRSS